MRLSELSYNLKQARESALRGVDDKIALASILSRLDNLEMFVEYLRSEELTPRLGPRPIEIVNGGSHV